MSSIKQVQDLEKQIDRVRRENSSLRRMLQERDGHMDVDTEGVEQLPLQLPEIGSEPKPKKRPTPLQGMLRARANVRNYSRGIWKPPAQYRLPAPMLFDAQKPELPTRQTTDHLLRSYYAAAHNMFPILHWPTFQNGVEDLYRPGGLQQVQLGWLSMFFAVLAVGSLFSADTPARRFYQPAEYVESSRKLVDPWNNDYVLDNARTLVLITICLNEMNLKSTAWNWLGSAVRVAQDIGLQSESGAWPVVEGEMRRRVWWTIYILDRSLAAELGRPVLIDDGDCDVSLPAGVDDHYLSDAGVRVPVGLEPLTHSLLAVIHVVRSYTALVRTLATPVIAPTRLSTFDQHFVACLRSFPPPCDPALGANVPLQPQFLGPLAYLLHARLLLHRHNLAPSCAPDVRMTAIEQCTHTALDTASLIARTSSSLADIATALLTTHLFRCSLFLVLAAYPDHAITCVRALAYINSRRDVAASCGRFIAFFVSTLCSKRAEYASYAAQTTPLQAFAPPRARTVGSVPTLFQEALLRDEELMVYVSADLQGSPGSGWVWAGAERDLPVHPSGLATAGGGAGSSLFSSLQRTGLTEEENQEWGGWERLEIAIRSLASGNPTPTPTSATWAMPGPLAIKTESGSSAPPPPPPLPTPGTGGAMMSHSPGADTNGDSPTGASKAPSKERISIANII
jgi:hypothetical protein